MRYSKKMDRNSSNDVLLACTIGDIAWLKRGLSHGIKPTATSKEVRESSLACHGLVGQSSHKRGKSWPVRLAVSVPVVPPDYD